MENERIEEIVHVDIELIEIVPGFLENRNKDVISLLEAIGKDEFDRIRIIGHTLKGIGGGYGFDKITELGATIEKAAIEQDTKGLRELISSLRVYLDNIEITFE